MTDDRKRPNRPVGGETHVPLESDDDETVPGRHGGADLDVEKQEKELRRLEEKR